MKQNFINEIGQEAAIKIGGQVSVMVADNDGKIHYRQHKKPNFIHPDLLADLAFAIATGSMLAIKSFGTASGNDGIGFWDNTAYSGTMTLMTSTLVSGNTTLAYVIFSGSKTISHNGSIQRFGIGHSKRTDGSDEFAVMHAYQTAAIAVSSGDTISATWTISCSTT